MEMLDDLADGLSTGMTPELIDEKSGIHVMQGGSQRK